MHISRTMVVVAGLAGALPLFVAFGIAWFLAATPGSLPGPVALYGIGAGLAVMVAILIGALLAGRTIDRRLELTEPRLRGSSPIDPGLVRRLARGLAIERGDPRGPALRRFILYAMPVRPSAVPVDVNEAVRVCVRTLQQTDPREARSLAFDPDPNADLTSLDPDLLHQVLLNLVLNARQAAGPEGEVEIRTQVLDGSVLIAVRDNGPGYPADEIPRLFEPFRSQHPGALGLGLAFCRQVVEAHGGTITATNIAPHGLEVGVTFPGSRRYPPEGKRKIRIS